MAGVLSHEGGDGEPAETKPSAPVGLRMHCGAAEAPEPAMLLFRKGTTLSWLVQKSSFRGEVWDAVVQDMTLATTGLQDHGATALHFHDQHVEGQEHRPHISVEYLPGEHTVFALDFSPPQSGSLLLTSLYFRQSQNNRVRILQHHLGRIIGLPYAYETSCGPELEPFEASFVSEEDDFQSPLNAQDAIVLGKLYGELDYDQEIEEACRATGKTMRRVEQQVAAAKFTGLGHVSAAGKTSNCKHMRSRGMCAS